MELSGRDGRTDVEEVPVEEEEAEFDLDEAVDDDHGATRGRPEFEMAANHAARVDRRAAHVAAKRKAGTNSRAQAAPQRVRQVNARRRRRQQAGVSRRTAHQRAATHADDEY